MERYTVSKTYLRRANVEYTELIIIDLQSN